MHDGSVARAILSEPKLLDILVIEAIPLRDNNVSEGVTLRGRASERGRSYREM